MLRSTGFHLALALLLALWQPLCLCPTASQDVAADCHGRVAQELEAGCGQCGGGEASEGCCDPGGGCGCESDLLLQQAPHGSVLAQVQAAFDVGLARSCSLAPAPLASSFLAPPAPEERPPPPRLALFCLLLI